MLKKTRSYYFHYIYILLDLVVTFGIIVISFLATVDIDKYLVPVMIYASSMAVLTVVVFALFKIYKMLTRDFGIFEAIKIFGITFAIQVIGLIAVIFIPQLPAIQNYIFGWLLSFGCLVLMLPAMRFVLRLRSIYAVKVNKKEYIKTLVVGAGASGKNVIDFTRTNMKSQNKVVAFIDDDPNKIDSFMAGVPIKGPISKIKSVVDYYDIEEVIIAINEIDNERLHEIANYLADSNVRIKKVPTFNALRGINDIQIIDVNINELLCRPTISLDNPDVDKMHSDKVVMVTGAGGSIGSELVKQIFDANPSKIILFDIYENSTYELQQYLKTLIRENKTLTTEIVTIIGSVYNEKTVDDVIAKYKPNYIYHAAAYKHVPLMEDSPNEAIKTNVIGTLNIAKSADKYGVEKVLLISTDKAINPTSVMGATKRLAEIIFQQYSKNSKTIFSTIRFGNVLGSNGSVVPLFRKQIEQGGPVTITNMEMVRYFITIPEATSLILECGLFANGGEIFVLDMGEPVKIINLAERLIRQAGLIPYKDIQIIETGLRPGEKLVEEALLNKERQKKTKNKKIFIDTISSNEKCQEEIDIIFNLFSNDNIKDLKEIINIK